MKLTREVRHLEGIKANFAVRNKEYIGIAALRKESQQYKDHQQEQLTRSQSHIIYSNVNGIIEQQQYLFDSLWDKSIPAVQRIKELEEGMYIVDNSKFLRVELVKPDAESFSEAIGFAVYSNNERSAELFRWMFELLWNDRITNEESNRVYKMEQEFVNIAAHELRAPVQSIVGYTELLLADPKYKVDPL